MTKKYLALSLLALAWSSVNAFAECVGIPEDCAYCEVSGCTAQVGCYEVGNGKCGGTPMACGAFEFDYECYAQKGCSWQ